jgi:hypothetical protein
VTIGIIVAIAKLLLGRAVSLTAAAAAAATVSGWTERISDDPSGWAFLLPTPTFVDERIGHDGSRTPISTIILRTTLRSAAIVLRRRRKSLSLFRCYITL